MKRAPPHFAAGYGEDDDDDDAFDSMPPPPGLPGAKRQRTDGGAGLAAEIQGDAALDGIELVKKHFGLLRHKASVNMEKRDSHHDEPEKFMDSELDLDDEIQEFRVASTVPESYEVLVGLHAPELLMQLLDHENLDIVCSTVAALKELIDPDALAECPSASALPEALVSLNIMKYLLLTVDRIMISGAIPDTDQQEEACYATLLVIDNLIDAAPAAVWGTPEAQEEEAAQASAKGSSKKAAEARAAYRRDSTHDLLAYLLRNVVATPSSAGVKFTALRSLSCELLAAILQISPGLAEGMHSFFIDKAGAPPQIDSATQRPDYSNSASSPDNINGIYCLLKCLSTYIKAPENDVSDEDIEYVENLFDALCSCLLHEPGKRGFDAAQGGKLLLRLIVPKKRKKSKAVKKEVANAKKLQHTLKHASLKCFAYSLQANAKGCEDFFAQEELSAVGVLFSFLMMVLKNHGADAQNTLEGHAVGILYELVQVAKGDNLQRISEKLVESGFEKSDRLVELFLKHRQRMQAFEKRNAKRKEFVNDAFLPTPEEEEADRLNEGGLLVSQIACAIARMGVYEPRVLRHVQEQLSMQGVPITEVLAEVEAAVDADSDTPFQAWCSKVLKDFRPLVAAK
eukprot:TRINITY_DN38154_c0_g1_i1.p1 TRINITY_DN38154_c0_g1~~TRINITY_DN38154_c0_g1_i1.p1  ORF type:complete len:627 (+),score=264.83 TRINITY_DN38154_c0_g1_i1:100-1980(+)